MGIEENKQAVREYCDAIGKMDVDRVKAVMHPDCVIWAAGNSFFSGKFDVDGLFKSGERVFSVFDDKGFAFDIKHLTAEENRVAAEMESVATHKDGTPYKNKYHFFFLFDDEGKILEYKEYMDTMHATEIIGYHEPNSKQVRRLIVDPNDA